MILFFDTETTGFVRKNIPHNDPMQARCCQIAALLTDLDGNVVEEFNHIIKPDGWSIPDRVAEIHGITNAIANEQGVPIAVALDKMGPMHDKSTLCVAHNFDFDNQMMEIESFCYPKFTWRPIKSACTMRAATNHCAIPHGRGGYKWPKLTELCSKLFGELEAQKFSLEAHDAMADIRMTMRCYFELVKLGIIAKHS
jgi:DNA polymerase III epsilon subunit-like protein